MDEDTVATVDQRFGELQRRTQQTAGLVAALAGKLSRAEGDPNAREWSLDLREIALALRDEQSTTTELLQAIHAVVDGHVQQASAAAPPPVQPNYRQPQYQQPQQWQPRYAPQYQSPPAQGGGTLQRFLGGRFGQAIVTGAGIGIGDDIVNGIFDRL
ncbi:hypothetical protein [Mycobacterium sp. NPDC006124]|uniref:hypothetical protein n=1 Tax=Mycobacterium sp. NPDC006124 TaxID=3156729 RepID=UPI0033B71862